MLPRSVFYRIAHAVGSGTDTNIFSSPTPTTGLFASKESARLDTFNNAAPTSQNIIYETSPVAGIVAPPGTATMLSGQIVNDATATKALTATSAITDAVNMYAHIKIWLQNGTGTSLKISATKSAGTITPLVGSYWMARQLPAANVGLFAS